MGDKNKDDEKTVLPQKIPFILHGLFGGTAGALGICVVQPADLIKTRMQLLGLQGKKPKMFTVAKDVIANEGFRNLYRGLSCAIFRQYTYGVTRFTIFYNLMEAYHHKYNELPHAGYKLIMGSFAGGGAAVIGTPAEVTLIRMTAEGNLPPEIRRGYTNVFNALYRIAREEGILTLWRGVGATVTRAMVVNAAELGSYAEARQLLLPVLGEGIGLHFCASMIAGLIATAVSLPVDIIKTRVQNAVGGASQFGVLREILKNEGIPALWSGFLPTYLKLGPHAVLTFVIFEQFYIMYFKFTFDPDLFVPDD